jgi:hypothetical protein
MRCASKCVVGGRSLRHYSLLVVGLIFGFSLSTIIHTIDMEVLRNSAGLQDTTQLSHHHREVNKVAFSNLKSRDVIMEERGQQEMADYSYDREEGVHSSVPRGEAVVKITPLPTLTAPKSPPSEKVVEVLSIDRLSEELPTRQALLVAVITSVHQLMTQTMSIQGTWAAHRAHQVLYFVGDVETLPHLPQGMEVVMLEGVDDGVGNLELKEIATVKYLTDNFLGKASWFMLIGDRTYLAFERLEARLSLLDSSSLVYMGLLGEDMMCNRDPGVVYSRAALESLGAYLPTCWPGGGQAGGDSLGGCLNTLGLHCTRAKEVSQRGGRGGYNQVKARFTTWHVRVSEMQTDYS